MNLPFTSFLRSLRRERDLPALAIVLVLLAYAGSVLLLPFSPSVRRAAQARFHLADWPLAAWAAFQPVPSMYNFENRWEVVFEGSTADSVTDVCPGSMTGFINHHVYHRLLAPVFRVRFERCGLPAVVRFSSTYRGTSVETTYRVGRGPGEHGLTVSRIRD